MLLSQLKSKTRFVRGLLALISGICFLGLTAALGNTTNSGISPANDPSATWKSLGTMVSPLWLSCIIVMLFFRGMEIRRQHPRPFH